MATKAKPVKKQAGGEQQYTKDDNEFKIVRDLKKNIKRRNKGPK